jgi:hypothetical protein
MNIILYPTKSSAAQCCIPGISPCTFIRLDGLVSEWITTAKSLLQDKWTTNYKQKLVPAETVPVGVFIYVQQYLFDTDTKYL